MNLPQANISFSKMGSYLLLSLLVIASNHYPSLANNNASVYVDEVPQVKSQSGENNSNTDNPITKKQALSCTEIVEGGELMTRNNWVDCSFNVGQYNATFNGEETIFLLLNPGGALSLCTRDPFGQVFNDVALQMWMYSPHDAMNNVELEILYSQQADGIAYTTGSDEEFDENFAKYTKEELNPATETFSSDLLGNLQDPLKEDNWTRIIKGLESASLEDLANHRRPIYNRISLRNIGKSRPIIMIIDNLVLVKNYTDKDIFINSKIKNFGCPDPRVRLPPPTEMESTFRSLLDASEVENQKSAVPLFAGLSCAIFVVLVTLVSVAIVLHTRRLRHLYIPFDELKFDEPPEVIGRGKFGYVLRARYGGFPVATKLVLPSGTYKRNIFDTNLGSSIGSHVSKGTLVTEYVNGTAVRESSLKESLVENLYSYDKPVEMVETQENPLMTYQELEAQESARTDLTTSSSKLLIMHNQNTSWKLKQGFEKEIRLLMKLRHPNIVTIMGVSKDPVARDYVLVMEHMDRGSLIDCLTNPTLNMEEELLMNIIKGITAGMAYLHNMKPAVTHNDLRAANILIDSNFTAKISDFGLSGKQNITSSSSRWPWTAPEILLGQHHCTKTDVYSFGVLLMEIYSRCRLTVSDMKLVIPSDVPPFVHTLIRQCINPNPDHRPTFKEILERISDEQCALNRSTSIIQTRNIMCAPLPAQIAEDLKLGKTPSPTSYKCVTLFMSDIVGYTELTCRLGPESVTNMLNRFYHKLDKLATKHHLYKIETIGDAYIAVGGMLEEDDPDHSSRVLRFAEDAMNAAKNTSISAHGLVYPSINIRVGIHSGPCIGAVVGELNPKFSLYGDTVNVVSRLENTGEAGRIHVSCDTTEVILKQSPELACRLNRRGQIELKGKGFMTTYWFQTCDKD